MLGLHLLIPLAASLLFLAYYTVSPWESGAKITAYFETVAIAFPLMLGLICSKAADLEGQAGGFQTMLCAVPSRTTAFAGKLIFLLLLGILSIALAAGVFAAGFGTAPFPLYLKLAGALLAANLFLYILHLFASLRFGRGASIGLGIAESLVSALALTGLGDGIWYFIPCTWGARLCDYLVYIWLHPSSSAFGNTEIAKGLLLAAVTFAAALAACLFWFRNWEGRKDYD